MRSTSNQIKKALFINKVWKAFCRTGWQRIKDISRPITIVSEFQKMKPFIIRTPRDFALVDCLIWEGKDDDEIFEILKKLRSETIIVADKLHCVTCFQPITHNECLECGQTIHEER